MEASNPLPEVHAASPILPATPTSVQSGPSTSTAAQAPMPPAAIMPPAALQYQFNIQQSLLMQQYALAQQAVVKAATVKSAAEVAAARAAEISKQLEKRSQSSSTSKSKSKSRSRSRSKSGSRSPSPLRSKSKSRSKSRSRSPIRKRRGRSNSLSPIRYRRDYHSSYRPREHYGYRGYNYRGYYRGGYNDYSGYRYGRERDYQYRRRRSRSRERRRSRTRSRSPRRRSRTRSRSPRRDRSRGRRSQSHSPPARNHSQTRSPRDWRKKSVSPHARRDGTKSRPIRTQSVSREAVRSPSINSGSINASPPAKSRTRSLSNAKDYNDDGSTPTERSHELDEEEQLASMVRKEKTASSTSSHGRRQSSSSPSRSLSVSLDNDSNRNASDKVASKRMPPGDLREPVQKSSSDEIPKRTSSVEKCSSDELKETPKRTSSDEHGSPVQRYISKVYESEGGNKNSGGGRRIRKPIRSSNAIFRDENESGDEIADDWRDDLKQVKVKGIVAYKDGDFDALEDRSRNPIDSSVKAIANDIEPKVESSLQSVSSAGQSDNTVVMGEQDVMIEKHYGHVVVHGEVESVRGQTGHLSVSETPKEACDDGDQLEKVSDVEVIFEGPKPASPVCEQRFQRYNVGADIAGHSMDMESPTAKRFVREKEGIGSLRIVEDDDYDTKDSNKHHSREKTVKDRSRSRDGKKYEGESVKREKRRDRHKKHRKKHRNTDEESAESDGARRRHKRKHRKEEEHSQKERKKRKHRHRTRSSSVSVEDSSSDSETEVRSRRRGRKRSSKKHKAAKRDVVESPPSSASLD